MIKSVLKRIIPASIFSAYHKLLAVFANIRYRFPSREMVVIGITGTKGKSTTAFMLVRILEEAGYTVGSLNTIFLKVADKEWPNKRKQSMLGRATLQKMLRRMVRNGCTHAVIEVTSEGILQHRQWGIAFDVAVFTNLSPEHIESHGSYKKYKEAKELIFKHLHKTYRKEINGKRVPKVIVVNATDKEAASFASHRADKKWFVSYGECDAPTLTKKHEYALCADSIKNTKSGVVVEVEDRYIEMRVHGEFMAHNALLAMAAAKSLGVSLSASEQALEHIALIPGRGEIILAHNGARVIVDYAHEPRSYEAIFKTARELGEKGAVISVFGGTGGGRDIKKRAIMGALAARYSRAVIVTTDDPYDEDPQKIANDILAGIQKEQPAWQEETNWFLIHNRKEAIKKALALAGPDDIVLLLGKGSEKTMAVAHGKKIKWNDADTVRELAGVQK